MNLYVDFDGTLFDSNRFLNDIYLLLDKYSIKKELFIKYKENCHNGFNPYTILNDIEKEITFSKKIYEDLDNSLANSKNYLYEDAIVFLKFAKERGYKIIIFTRGNKQYQELKIINSKINKYYDDLIITLKHKGELDIDYKNSIFIDDNITEIKSILKNNPKEIICINRSEDNKKDDIRTITSLYELIDKKIK